MAKLHPGTKRDVQVLPGATSQTCDVTIPDEGITLSFIRGESGRVAVVGRSHETSDTPLRASDDGYRAAVRLADKTMSNLDAVLKEREAAVHEHIRILDTSTAGCVLEYLGHRCTYEVLGGERVMLRWESLRMNKQEDGRLVKTGILPILTARELQALKQRALTVVQIQRGRQGYGNKGLGEPQNLGQLTLSL